MTTPDDLTAELARFHEYHQQHVSTNYPEPGICVSRDGKWPCDSARLLAAVEAVLKLHQPVTTNGGWLEGREWQECGECGPNNGCEHVTAMPGQGESFWPCPTYLAISREITGKGESDGA